jgi:hypothetical protein
LLYFCEWIAIVAADGIDVLFAPGTAPSTVVTAYQTHSDAFAWASGWFGVVLFGRVVFAAAVARVLSEFREGVLAAVGALTMAAGVLFETTAYAIVAGTATAADHGADPGLVTALDSTSFAIEKMLWGVTGLGVLALSVAMLRTHRFPRVLGIVGTVSGAALVIEGLAFNAPSQAGVQDALQIAVLPLWVWMLWTGVFLWRGAAGEAGQP